MSYKEDSECRRPMDSLFRLVESDLQDDKVFGAVCNVCLDDPGSGKNRPGADACKSLRTEVSRFLRGVVHWWWVPSTPQTYRNPPYC